MYIFISKFPLEENISSLQCLHLFFPTKHTFFSCQALVVIWPFSTKAPSFQWSSIELKARIFTKVAPQVATVLQEPHLFFKERKKQSKSILIRFDQVWFDQIWSDFSKFVEFQAGIFFLATIEVVASRNFSLKNETCEVVGW